MKNQQPIIIKDPQQFALMIVLRTLLSEIVAVVDVEKQADWVARIHQIMMTDVDLVGNAPEAEPIKNEARDTIKFIFGRFSFPHNS